MIFFFIFHAISRGRYGGFDVILRGSPLSAKKGNEEGVNTHEKMWTPSLNDPLGR